MGATKQQLWDWHWIKMALQHATMSKDPSTRVGAMLIGPNGEIIGGGFNGFPRGIADMPALLADRDTKLKLMVHAEMNAILGAARRGITVAGSTLYLAATDNSGAIWGGAPCTRCTVEIIQAGVTRIRSPSRKATPSRWAEDIAFASDLLEEAGIDYLEVDDPASLICSKCGAEAWESCKGVTGSCPLAPF